jgi:hypothetical protein
MAKEAISSAALSDRVLNFRKGDMVLYEGLAMSGCNSVLYCWLMLNRNCCKYQEITVRRRQILKSGPLKIFVIATRFDCSANYREARCAAR